MNNKVYTINEIKAIVSEIAKNYPLKEVYLFGSYARGEATEKSDIDLAVRFADGIAPTFRMFSSFIVDLEEALDKSVDCIPIDSMSVEFRYEIADDEVLMYA